MSLTMTTGLCTEHNHGVPLQRGVEQNTATRNPVENEFPNFFLIFGLDSSMSNPNRSISCQALQTPWRRQRGRGYPELSSVAPIQNLGDGWGGGVANVANACITGERKQVPCNWHFLPLDLLSSPTINAINGNY